MDSSNETPQAHVTNQLHNPLQFTIHLPASSSSPNPESISTNNFNFGQTISISNSNSIQDHFLSAPIPKRRRRRRPRTLVAAVNQVRDTPFMANNNNNSFENSSPSITKRHSSSSISGNVGNRIVNDVSEEIIVINKEAMNEALVALSVGFPADSLTDEETDAGVVSVVGGIEQVNYILIRNHIIAKWRENVSWLTKDMFVGIIPQHCGVLLDIAYNYLVLHGFINFGVGPGVKEKILVEPSKQNVIVVGAGLAGLAAARQLMAFGYKVTVLEGRKRAGGRVYTKKLEVGNRSAVADLGGSVLTGILGNPLGIVARQLSCSLHKVRDKCPLYKPDGKPVDHDLDVRVENGYNRLLDKVSKLRQMMGEISQDVSLGAALETFSEVHNDSVNEDGMNLFHWHLANLEYANAGLLSNLSLAFWDQDDPFDMGGDHCFLPGGNGRLVQALAENVNILYEKTVQAIRYRSDGVQVAAGGQVYDADMALCTVPLGVLKSGSIKFIPELPQRKLDGIKRLGFGLLNKVAMLFPHAFWGTDLDTFGHLTDNASTRGEFFLFYSYATVAGGPVLMALVAGEAAHKFETTEPTEAVTKVLTILKGIYEPQGIEVPDPLQTVCTRWGGDPFSLGSYSNVAVGASGDDYDILAESVGDGRLFFAGEATNRRYPATMHGALLSGFREAANMDHYAKVRASNLKVEKNPSEDAFTCASILADLFREPDVEFGGYSVIFGRKKCDSTAILRITFGGRERNLNHQQGSNSLLFEQLQSHFDERQEFHVYTVLTKEQALALREVRGGDRNRLTFLTEKLGVKLSGRKGLGPEADSVIASIKGERSSRKPAAAGKSKPKAAPVKQSLIRKAKIVRSAPSTNGGTKIVSNGIKVESRTVDNGSSSTNPSSVIGNSINDPVPQNSNNVAELMSGISGLPPQHLSDTEVKTELSSDQILVDHPSGSNAPNIDSTAPPISESGVVELSSNSCVAPSNSNVNSFSENFSSMSVQDSSIFEDIMNDLLPSSGTDSGTWRFTGNL